MRYGRSLPHSQRMCPLAGHLVSRFRTLPGSGYGKPNGLAQEGVCMPAIPEASTSNPAGLQVQISSAASPALHIFPLRHLWAEAILTASGEAIGSWRSVSLARQLVDREDHGNRSGPIKAVPFWVAVALTILGGGLWLADMAEKTRQRPEARRHEPGSRRRGHAAGLQRSPIRPERSGRRRRMTEATRSDTPSAGGSCGDGVPGRSRTLVSQVVTGRR